MFFQHVFLNVLLGSFLELLLFLNPSCSFDSQAGTQSSASITDMSVGSSEALDQVLFYNLEETNVKSPGISSPEILPWSDRSDTSCEDECCI